MPLPTPRKGESKNNFIARFMRLTQEEFKSQSQRMAVAIKQWGETKKKGGSK